ncbi:STAS domain-containing protein [Streptomyces sp. NPDC006193]|uniref:STAS domain-containing protein n=1 Tax=Streptomyces sp. NPDC006193 TaxID=3155717 RepID=UPI0033B89874
MYEPARTAPSLPAPDFPRLATPGREGLAGGLSVSWAPDGSRVRVRVRGDLDLDSGRRLRQGLDEALAHATGGLDLDLSGVGFCDCAGLNVLLELRHRALGQGKTLVVRAGAPAVDRLLRLVGADELFASPQEQETRSPRPVAAASPEAGASGAPASPGAGSAPTRPHRAGRREACRS